MDFGIHKLPKTDKIVSYPICKFCACGTFKKEDGYHCFVCGRIYFEKEGIWYYSNSRKSMKCKIEHLV